MNEVFEKCVICSAPIQGVFELNNPWPVNGKGHCCGSCNATVVVPARLALYFSKDKEGEVDENDSLKGRILELEVLLKEINTFLTMHPEAAISNGCGYHQEIQAALIKEV